MTGREALHSKELFAYYLHSVIPLDGRLSLRDTSEPTRISLRSGTIFINCSISAEEKALSSFINLSFNNRSARCRICSKSAVL